ncbi:MAG: ACS family MFS transporter, partial [Gammaproteobacteria bacterium]|nr:ACS family MFS transporter [Gammaproteobacteria bacterium]
VIILAAGRRRRLGDKFGWQSRARHGCAVVVVVHAAHAPAALMGLSVLIATRVGMGMGEAVTFPSIYSLYSRWIPLAERSRAVAIANSGIPLGTVFALVATPYIVQAWGWEWAFYSFGLVGVVWFVVWQRTVTASPDTHAGIDAAELALIQIDSPAERPARPKWGEFFSKMPVWAIIVAHFCNNWSLYVLLSWLPTFVNKGLGVDYGSVGWVTMIPHIASFVMLNVAGNVADRMIKSGMDVGRVRKICQTIGFGGIAGALSIVGEVDSVWMAITIMSIGNGLGAFVTGGFAVNHMDIAPKHAGTLMGITNTAGTIPGIIGVSVSGLILQQTGSWALVFQVAAGVTLFGLLFYLLFSSGKKLID